MSREKTYFATASLVIICVLAIGVPWTCGMSLNVLLSCRIQWAASLFQHSLQRSNVRSFGDYSRKKGSVAQRIIYQTLLLNRAPTFKAGSAAAGAAHPFSVSHSFKPYSFWVLCIYIMHNISLRFIDSGSLPYIHRLPFYCSNQLLSMCGA